MKNLGYWGKDDRTVRSHGFIYNIDTFVVDEKNHMTCWPQNIVSAKHVLREEGKQKYADTNDREL